MLLNNFENNDLTEKLNKPITHHGNYFLMAVFVIFMCLFFEKYDIFLFFL